MSGDGGEGRLVGLFESVWRHVRALVLVVALAAGGGYLLSSRQPARYEATTVLLFSDNTLSPFNQNALPWTDRGRYLATQADRLASPAVTAAAARSLGDGTTAEEVATGVVGFPGELTDTLAITGTAPEPARAARLANAAADGYLAVLREEARAGAAAAASRLQREYDEVQRRIVALRDQWPPVVGAATKMSLLESRLREIGAEQTKLEVAAQVYQPDVQVIRPAVAPAGPVSPKPLRDAGLAALIALLGAAAAAWAYEAGAQRRGDPGRFGRLLDAECLGRVPSPPDAPAGGPEGLAGGLAVAAGVGAATTPAADAALQGRWQQVVSAVDASLRERGGQCLLVAAPSPAEHPGRLAASLAISAAADGRSVVVVDADHASRELSMLAGAAGAPGLTELVETNGCLQRGDGNGRHRGVDLLPAGRPVANPAAFYRSAPFRAALATIGRCADLVLVVAPPVLGRPDAGVLADSSDAVLLAVRQVATDDELLQTRAGLSWSSAPLLGYLVLEPAGRRAGSWRRLPRSRRRAHANPPDDPPPLAGVFRPLRLAGHNPPPNGRLPAPTSAPAGDPEV